MLILVINPGSTSTKLAIYEDERELLKKSISHPTEKLREFSKPSEQREFRAQVVKEFLDESGYAPEKLGCIVARGAGGLPPIHGGAYVINRHMIDRLTCKPTMDGNTNLAALIAYDLAEKNRIPAFIYDGVSVDEMLPFSRISGIKEYPRSSRGHTLNSRATARKVAQDLGKPYADCVFIVAHIGGGYSVDIHWNGKIVDVIPANEGSFTTERVGGLTGETIVQIVNERGFDFYRQATRGHGGLVSHFGTHDAQKVEQMILDGDAYAALVIEAMAYETAKSICGLAAMTGGKVDAIIMTGGLAHYDRLVKMVEERVRFLAPVVVEAGEFELEALAMGGLRVMRGEETAEEYSDADFHD